MTTTTEQEWQLPLNILMEAHRARIAGNEDIVPAMVETWHIGEPGPSWTVWIANPGEIGPRDAGLYAGKVMASATSCDYLVFSYDTHMTSLVHNPKTGKPWQHGEMQAMCDEEGFCETGQMRDNLMISVVRRSDCKLYCASIPYHFHKGEVIFYDEPDPMDEANSAFEGKMLGIVPNGLREAMTMPTITSQLREMGALAAFNMAGDEPKVRLHQILAGVRTMNDAAHKENLPQMFLNMISAHSEEERELIEHSAKRNGFEAVLL